MSRNTPWRTTRKMYSLHQQGNDWYRIRNQKDGPTQLHIYDEIGYFGVSAGDLIRDLADVGGPLEVHLNSPGGEVFDGIAIYNVLLARHDVTIMIDGLAASIASVIAMAGNPVLVARNAQMMVHDGFGMAIGNAQDMRDLAELLDRTIDNGAGRQVKETSHDKWDMGVFRGAKDKPDAEPAHIPWDPDGDGDDDSTPEGDLDYSHWDRNGRQLQDVPGKPLHQGNLIDIRSASVDSSPWDAARAMHNAATSDNPASFYNGICAGKRDGDPSNQASHALPHHYHPGDAPNAAGVRAALGRISGTQGLTNKDAAQSHLEAHMRSINPDWKPSGDKTDANPFGLSDEEIKKFTASLRL